MTVEKVAQDIKEKDRNDLDLACRLAYYFQIGSEVFLNIQQIYDLDAGKVEKKAELKNKPDLTKPLKTPKSMLN